MAKGFDLISQRSLRLRPERIIETTERSSPLVVSIPHSGTWIPQEALGHIETSSVVLIDTDILTDRVYEKVAEQGSYVLTRVNPYVVNVNRGYTKPELPIIPRQLLSGQATLLKKYSATEQRRLIGRYYDSYHSALQHLINRAVRRFGFALLLDGHGMDRQGMTHTKDPGERRADLVVGDNEGKSAHQSVVAAALAYLTRSGYEVGHNKPYSGGHITRAYGDPKNRVQVIQIELVKSLYCRSITTEFDAVGIRRLTASKGMPKLQQDLREALQAALRAASIA